MVQLFVFRYTAALIETSIDPLSIWTTQKWGKHLDESEP